MIVADRAWAEKKGLSPMARLVSYGVGAVEPGMFGLGPVPAVKQALDRAGWKAADIQRIEINEAFAAIAIAVTKELGLDTNIVNVEGGAIAHGHPIGATGAVLTTRLLHSMKRDGMSKGVVTLCIGGGQGIALALQSVNRSHMVGAKLVFGDECRHSVALSSLVLFKHPACRSLTPKRGNHHREPDDHRLGERPTITRERYCLRQEPWRMEKAVEWRDPEKCQLDH